MRDLKQTLSELRAEADVDFLHVPLIAGAVKEDLALRDPEDIRRCTLDMIRRLMAVGVYPGDYDYARTMSFWPGTPDDLVKRIESEWIAMDRAPDLERPICWFGLRQAPGSRIVAISR